MVGADRYKTPLFDIIAQLTAAVDMERKMPTETVDGAADAQALTTICATSSSSSSASKLSEKKKPPRKKLTATKSEKPRKVEANIPWKKITRL